jgi:hypothetical protein
MPRLAALTAGAGVLTCSIALVGSLAVPARARPAAPLAFAGAALGMSLADWLKLPPPGPLAANARASCYDSTGDGGPALALTSVERAEGATVCSYASSYGRSVLPQTFSMRTYRVARLRYVFVADRLVEIDCRAPVDAYAAVTAWLGQRYGLPDKVVRDHARSELGELPRVTQIWSTPTGAITLTDPVAPFANLEIRMSARPTKSIQG